MQIADWADCATLSLHPIAQRNAPLLILWKNLSANEKPWPVSSASPTAVLKVTLLSESLRGARSAAGHSIYDIVIIKCRCISQWSNGATRVAYRETRQATCYCQVVDGPLAGESSCRLIKIPRLSSLVLTQSGTGDYHRYTCASTSISVNSFMICSSRLLRLQQKHSHEMKPRWVKLSSTPFDSSMSFEGLRSERYVAVLTRTTIFSIHFFCCIRVERGHTSVRRTNVINIELSTDPAYI